LHEIDHALTDADYSSEDPVGRKTGCSDKWLKNEVVAEIKMRAGEQ